MSNFSKACQYYGCLRWLNATKWIHMNRNIFVAIVSICCQITPYLNVEIQMILAAKAALDFTLFVRLFVGGFVSYTFLTYITHISLTQFRIVALRKNLKCGTRKNLKCGTSIFFSNFFSCEGSSRFYFVHLWVCSFVG